MPQGRPHAQKKLVGRHKRNSVVFVSFFCGLVNFVIFILLFFFLLFEREREKEHKVEWVVGGEDLGGVRGGAKHDKIYCMKNII